MLPVTEAVSIPFVAQFIDDEGELQANETMEKAADAMLDELSGSPGRWRRCGPSSSGADIDTNCRGEARILSRLSPPSELCSSSQN